MLSKSKYSFFSILAFGYSKAQAKMLLRRLNKRGHELCNDEYLDIFTSLTYNMEIRKIQQIQALHRFTDVFAFDDYI
jgi:hypothetical protein